MSSTKSIILVMTLAFVVVGGSLVGHVAMASYGNTSTKVPLPSAPSARCTPVAELAAVEFRYLNPVPKLKPLYTKWEEENFQERLAEVDTLSSEIRENPHLPLFLKAAERFHVPLNFLLAISRHESGFHPWALNLAGKSVMPKTKDEALRILRSDKVRSYDVGLMQINSFWLRRFKVSNTNALRPEVNVFLGAYILSEAIAEHGATWKAVAAYHTPPAKNPRRAEWYAKSIFKEISRLSGTKEK